MIQSKLIPRKFVVNLNGTSQEIADPNPLLSIEQVKDMLSHQYPQLVNSRTTNKGLVEDSIIIEFDTIAGTKG